MRSYVKTRLGLLPRINEAWNLYHSHTRNVGDNVRQLLDQARIAESKLELLLGKPVKGLKMLEIGPGQQLLQLAYFGMHNEVVGIDLDVIAQRMNITGFVQMAKQNGWVRTCKTVARKMVGIDSKVRKELLSQLGLHSLPNFHVLQMDAAKMEFPDEQFDVVFSRAVFEHIPNPEAVISEMRRVLKPNGVMFIALHLYSSDSGCHDTRIFVGNRETLPFWAHLRPEHESEARPNSYLNKLSLAEWRRVFEAEMQSSEIIPLCDAGEAERKELLRLRSQDQLASYSDEELLTVTLQVRWRKPMEFQSADPIGMGLQDSTMHSLDLA